METWAAGRPRTPWTSWPRSRPCSAASRTARLDRDGPLHWPCRTPDDPGEPRLYLERFATPGGRASLAARPYLPPGEQADADYPFLLVTGRRLEHYNAGTMTRRTANIELLPEERLEMHPRRRGRLGLSAGESAEVPAAAAR